MSSLISMDVNAPIQCPSMARRIDQPRILVVPSIKGSSHYGRNCQRAPPLKKKVAETFKKASGMVLDAVVDLFFKFSNQEYLPSQKNFAPVGEIGDKVPVTCAEGEIPAGFPEGIFVRNGGNPLFGALQSVASPFGTTKEIWVEGDGMLHALFFEKINHFDWSVLYKNKFVESETYKDEKKRNKPRLLPAIDGNPTALLAAFFLNQMRYGTINKHMANTNVFSQGGRLYAIAENHMPLEIDSRTLETIGYWQTLGAAWGRPCTSHPKRAPGTGELVLIEISPEKPFFVVGVVSDDGKQLLHKADVDLGRAIVSHDLGVTQRYNVLIDHPLTISVERVYKGGKLIKFGKDGYARIGVMPRYGDAISIHWFDVEPNCILHILNCFEDGNEVTVRGCTARDAIIAGPDDGEDPFEWYSRGFKHVNAETVAGDEDESYLFHRVHEWRLNMATGQVIEGYVSGTDFSMEFPFINDDFIGLKNKYGYTQVVNSEASSEAGLVKFSRLAKLYFDEPPSDQTSGGKRDSTIKITYHDLGENSFCSGSVFVPKQGGNEEDDGWIITFVHNEETDVSQIHVIDAKNFEAKAVTKINLPQRVPYGFHATFMKKH